MQLYVRCPGLSNVDTEQSFPIFFIFDGSRLDYLAFNFCIDGLGTWIRYTL